MERTRRIILEREGKQIIIYITEWKDVPHLDWIKDVEVRPVPQEPKSVCY